MDTAARKILGRLAVNAGAKHGGSFRRYGFFRTGGGSLNPPQVQLVLPDPVTKAIVALVEAPPVAPVKIERKKENDFLSFDQTQRGGTKSQAIKDFLQNNPSLLSKTAAEIRTASNIQATDQLINSVKRTLVKP
jgi:hypothetical protein